MARSKNENTAAQAAAKPTGKTLETTNSKPLSDGVKSSPVKAATAKATSAKTTSAKTATAKAATSRTASGAAEKASVKSTAKTAETNSKRSAPGGRAGAGKRSIAAKIETGSVPSPAGNAGTAAAKKTARKASADESPIYDNQSIVMLKGADRVRKRPSIVFGSDGLDGCKQGFFEILANSIDEAIAGYGKEIRVTVFLDHSMEIEDFGRGVPLGYNQNEGRFNWELVFCELFAGGKMDNNTGESAYKCSLGTNGVGACATQYASEYMNVDSFDGNKVSFIRFEHGEVVGGLETRELARDEKRTGTIIRWLPDLEVFTDINIPGEYFADVLHRQAAINFGVRFVLHIEQEDGSLTEETFYYQDKNGLSDYVTELSENRSITEPVYWHAHDFGRDRDDKEDYPLDTDYAFCFTQATGKLEYYHNSSYLEHGGSPDRAARNAFVYSIDKYLRNAGKYNKTEQKVTFVDISDSLVLVISSRSSIASYENQTKKAITNSFIYDSMTEFMKHNLDIYLTEHPTEADKIATQILINKRSRENAEKTRIDIKKQLSGSLDVANRVEKFVNCRSKDPERRELYIVEGDSALTSCKLGRSAEFQAIIPVRGKTLNCMKSDYKKIFDNDIIVDLIRVIGCGVEIEGKKSTKKGDMNAFDLASLRWAKIIICTDADEDGFQIRTLLLTMFYRLLPTLIEQGKIYIAESPLFEITTRDNTYFAFDEVEKAEIMQRLEGTKYTLQRSKGLGENEPEMMWETTMNPATRRLVAVKPADAYSTEQIFDTLLGDNLAARKAFIAENSSRYMKDADI